ncbi:hypothetical protein HF325_000332 [Metschnikowia pulcherrima]|uniref:Uncharacterized protein n=1 Tax=Metschnikowia pulcherrima TaxID=27326 RepID=A0A8H7LEP8_9ASCO|nr:hypothetical protein HF325_000332 [Metschnikowia pulcherrima]
MKASYTAYHLGKIHSILRLKVLKKLHTALTRSRDRPRYLKTNRFTRFRGTHGVVPRVGKNFGHTYQGLLKINL